MKQIIDISDELFNIFKKHGIMAFDYVNEYDKDQIAIAITHGTPYSPSGDAISHEDLKKAIEEVEDNYDGYEPNDLGKFMSKVYDLIDNAQAVDLWQMRQEATENALKKAEVLYDRSQGKWIRLDLAKRVIAKFEGYLDDDMVARIQIALEKENEADMKGDVE